jgi:acyl CoA:acetate/3-ketoacid CoA transferase beta subunit
MSGAMDPVNRATDSRDDSAPERQIKDSRHVPSATPTRRVTLVITDMAVIEPTDTGLVLREIAPALTLKRSAQQPSQACSCRFRCGGADVDPGQLPSG